MAGLTAGPSDTTGHSRIDRRFNRDSQRVHFRRRQNGHLTKQQKQDILRDNTARVFNLPAGADSWRKSSEAVA